MLDDIDEELISVEQIAQRVAELGARISDDYRERHLTIIIVSNGAVIFGADLVRQITIPLQLDMISASSYSGTVSRENLDIRSRCKLDVRGRDVVIVDDILDTGVTLENLVQAVRDQGAHDVKTCVLLDKQHDQERGLEADYAGFHIRDEWVVGYGLDYNERYRHLGFVGVLSPACYATPEA